MAPTIHAAAGRGDLEEVRVHVLRDPSSIEALNPWSRGTALHDAAAGGHTDVCRFLLDAGARINRRDRYRRTALNEACFKGHVAVAMLLLRRGADAMIPDRDGYLPLTLASDKGHTAIVSMLLESLRVTVDGVDDVGKSALWWAAYSGHPECVEVLLQAGADALMRDKHGVWRPVDVATQWKHAACVELLQAWESMYTISRARRIRDDAFLLTNTHATDTRTHAPHCRHAHAHTSRARRNTHTHTAHGEGTCVCRVPAYLRQRVLDGGACVLPNAVVVVSKGLYRHMRRASGHGSGSRGIGGGGAEMGVYPTHSGGCGCGGAGAFGSSGGRPLPPAPQLHTYTTATTTRLNFTPFSGAHPPLLGLGGAGGRGGGGYMRVAVVRGLVLSHVVEDMTAELWVEMMEYMR